jgi:hypothetical protein
MPVASVCIETLRRHAGLIIVAMFTLGVAIFVSDKTKNSLDMDGVEMFAWYLGISIWCLASLYAAYRLVWLAVVAKDPSPFKTFLKPYKSFLLDGPRMVNFVVAMAAMTAFVVGFGVLKGAIALLNPFKWDVAFADIDRWLHFGRLPHEYFWWLIEWPAGIFAINFLYNMWFFVMISTIVIVAAAREDTPLRQQYLMSYMAIWLIAGFFIATTFSSAGPCFFEDLGLGYRYKPLMDALERSSEVWPIWALKTQDMLWEGYKHQRAGSLGISAFPVPPRCQCNPVRLVLQRALENRRDLHVDLRGAHHGRLGRPWLALCGRRLCERGFDLEHLAPGWSLYAAQGRCCRGRRPAGLMAASNSSTISFPSPDRVSRPIRLSRLGFCACAEWGRVRSPSGGTAS